MKKVNQRILASFVIVGMITVLGLLAQRYTSLDWLIVQEDRLRALVRERPVTLAELRESPRAVLFNSVHGVYPVSVCG